MIIHSLLLKSYPILLGKGMGVGHGHTKPSSEKLSQKREDTYDHTEPSSEQLACSSGNGKGRWS